MKDFKEFLRVGEARRQRPNIDRAKSLITEATQKKAYLELTIKTIPKGKRNPNVIAEQCYDIIMEILRAKMFLDGYTAGNSHEAEVSYMKILGFNESETRYMDELRYYRNGTKYYGTILNIEYANKIIELNLGSNFLILKSI